MRRFLPLGLFFVLFALYESNGDYLQTNDATGNVYLSLSLLRDGDVVFAPSEAPQMFAWEIETPQGVWRGTPPNWAAVVNGVPLRELYKNGQMKVRQPLYFVVPTPKKNALGEPLFANTFGPAAGLTALPVVIGASALGLDLDNPQLLWHLAKLTAALLAAGSALLLFATARLWLGRRASVLLAIAYGLGTSMWSLGSQALWQQTAASFGLALSFYFWMRVMRDHSRPESAAGGAPAWCLVGASLAFGFAVACRPTSLAPALVAAGSLLWIHRRSGLVYLGVLLVPLLILASYNNYYLGSPFSFGQSEASRAIAQSKTGSSNLWQTPLWTGAAGLLFSPSRGLFVFSPFLLAGFIGLTRLCDERWRALRFVPLAVLPVMLSQFLWFDWWGGWCYGPRPLLDMLFPLCLLLVPAWEWLAQNRARLTAFGVLVAWSILVQFVGAFAYDSVGWNNLQRQDIDKAEYRHRLWSLQDNQIGYYLTHFGESRVRRQEQVQAMKP